jgi:hypothetical protein
MAEEKMKFTFLDDNGKPIENKSEATGQQVEDTQSEDTTQTEDENTELQTESDDIAAEGNTDEGADNEGEEATDTQADNESEQEGELEDESDEAEADSQQEETQEEDDVVDYDELPEAVQRYLDFMEDTGGSLEDFVNINQDLSKLPQDDVIGRFLKSKYPTLDAEDINYEIESRFGETEDDTESDIRRKKVEKKKFYAEALSSLKSNTEKYKVELGSSATIPAKAKEALDFVKNYNTQQEQTSKRLEAVRSSFVKETNKVLSKDFKGFEIKVGDKVNLYKPENLAKTKEQNMDVNNFLNRFLDKDGGVKDVQGYHKALAIASEPERFAQHFFELGKAAMVEEDTKTSKNVKTDTRGIQPNMKSKQPKFKFLDAESPSEQGKIRLKNY